MNTKTMKIVMTSLLAALKIPSPLNGYINLGDCVVLAAGWMLSPIYAFFSAGIGSALADLLSGYATYAPATFVIKGLMALVAFYGFKLLHNKLGKITAQIIAGFIAEIIMILGYFVFEGFLYGFAPSVVNIPANAVQGVAGLIAGILLVKIFEKSKKAFK